LAFPFGHNTTNAGTVEPEEVSPAEPGVYDVLIIKNEFFETGF